MLPGPKLALAALVLSLAATSDAGADDLSAQRLVCQQEARQHIKGPRRADLEIYRLSVERRQTYVRDCMETGPRDVEETGSLAVPLPPRRPRV